MFVEPSNYERNIANIANWRCSSTAIVALDGVPTFSKVVNGHLGHVEMHEGCD
jgi:hypothetical protein